MTIATPVRLPQGNSGREYHVAPATLLDGLVRIMPMTGRQVLPSQVADLTVSNARTLGAELIGIAMLDDIGTDRHDTGTASAVSAHGSGRTYRVRLRPGVGGRRVQLVVSGRDGEMLTTVSDTFTAAGARALGIDLIAATGADKDGRA